MQVDIAVTVTAEDLKLGIPGDCYVCPAARAISRELPPDSSVEVNGRLVYWWEGEDVMHTGRLPKEAIRSIIKFDKGTPVRPFKFLIQVLS